MGHPVPACGSAGGGGEKVVRFSKRVVKLLHLRDYDRIDLRPTPEGVIVFLKANPDSSPDSELALSAAKAGLENPQRIDRILNLALRRAHPGPVD